MRLIKSSVEIITPIYGEEILNHIEKCAKVCYKSNNAKTDINKQNFIKNIINRKHESVLEHFSITVKVICDRGILAELTRHRLASFSVESTRYCSYNKDKFDNQITTIEPCFYYNRENNIKLKERFDVWEETMEYIEKSYMKLIELGATPQEARNVLSLSTKTEMYVTANLREWRHIFKLRTDKNAHPQIIEIMKDLLEQFKSKINVVFDDIMY